MLTLYQDTKMSIEGVSFTIPKSFYIVVDEDFCPVKSDGLVFTTQEKNCCIEVYTEECDAPITLYHDFTSILKEENMYTIHGKIEEKKENVFYSVRAIYESKHHTYFEMHMVRLKGYDKSLKMLITVEKRKADISDILRREDITQFINSFKAIKPTDNETEKAVD